MQLGGWSSRTTRSCHLYSCPSPLNLIPPPPLPRPLYRPSTHPRLVSFRRHNHRHRLRARVHVCVCVCVTGTKTPYNLLERHDTPCRAAEIYIQPKSSLMLIVPKTVRYTKHDARSPCYFFFFLSFSYFLFLLSFSFLSYLSVNGDNDRTSSQDFE